MFWAVRIGPNGIWNGISDSDPQSLFSHVAEHLNHFPLAYLSLIEPRIAGSDLVDKKQGPIAAEWLRPIFKGNLISGGGFEPDTAEAAVSSGIVDAVVFGRHFISNPDLPRRIKDKLALAPYNRDTFYTFDALGYTDYPAYEDALVAQ